MAQMNRFGGDQRGGLNEDMFLWFSAFSTVSAEGFNAVIFEFVSLASNCTPATCCSQNTFRYHKDERADCVK